MNGSLITIEWEPGPIVGCRGDRPTSLMSAEINESLPAIYDDRGVVDEICRCNSTPSSLFVYDPLNSGNRIPVNHRWPPLGTRLRVLGLVLVIVREGRGPGLLLADVRISRRINAVQLPSMAGPLPIWLTSLCAIRYQLSSGDLAYGVKGVKNA